MGVMKAIPDFAVFKRKRI